MRGADLKISVAGNRLQIRGVRKPPTSEDVLRLHQSEIAYGPFDRSVAIPFAFDSNAVKARLQDGVLRINLSKRMPPQVQIPVEGE